MSIFDNLTVQDFKTQFPRFSPMYLSEITYISTKTYFKDDVVYYDDKFYICIVESTSSEPTTTSDWKIYNSSILNYTQDSDITNAYAEAKVNFNENLFGDEATALMVFLYLSAFFLTHDFNTALGNNNSGILTSKSVGSVSEGYTIPLWMQESSTLSMYATNLYGVKYCTLIKPYLCGNIILIHGDTTVS